MKNRRMDRAAGFTLVEAMIVVTILAVLAAMAVPSFNSLIESQRAGAAASDLDTALVRARSEAIKQNASVTLESKGGWASGWQISDPATGALIEDHAAVPGLVIAGPDDVTYQSSGRVQGGTPPTFSITGSFDSSARCVNVDLSGRPVVKKGGC